MRFLLLLVMLSCERMRSVNLEVGDCVIGEGMDIWKLIRADQRDGKYMFAINPVGKDSLVQVVEDVSTFKKVQCPN